MPIFQVKHFSQTRIPPQHLLKFLPQILPIFFILQMLYLNCKLTLTDLLGSSTITLLLQMSAMPYSLGIGSFYPMYSNVFIVAGIKYFRLNKAKVKQNQEGSGSLFGMLSSVNHNKAVVYSLKPGYRF